MNNVIFVGKSNQEIMNYIVEVLNDKESNEKFDTRNILYIKDKNYNRTFENAICYKDYECSEQDNYDLVIFELNGSTEDVEQISSIIEKILSNEQKIIISVSSITYLDNLNIKYKFIQNMNRNETIKAYQLI